MSRTKVTKEDLIKLYINDPTATHESVAKKLGASRAAVLKAMKRHGLESRNTAGNPRVEIPELSDGAWLEQKFIKESLSAASIGTSLNCSSTTVLNALKKYGIDTQRLVNPLLGDKLWLEEQYITKQRTYEDIGNEIGVTKYGVYHAMQRFGIKARLHTSQYLQLNDKEWLKKKYIDEGMSIPDIARLVGCTVGAIHSSLIHMGIETRGYKEGLQAKFPEGRWGEDASNWKGGLPKCIDCGVILANMGATRCRVHEGVQKRKDGNPNWKGGVSSLNGLIRVTKEFKAWRKAIYERDSYTCQMAECGKSLLADGITIHADHYPKPFAVILEENSIASVEQAILCKELWDLDNGRVLCKDCHMKTDTYGGGGKKRYYESNI